MMRRTERHEVLVAPEIPLDLQFEILKRLPVKSFARFKCVSKCWSSLIHSQGYFFSSPPRLFITLTCDNPVKPVLLSLAPTSKSTAFDLDMMIDGIGEYFMAFRGLILYNCGGSACIYNPTTEQRLTLPPTFNLLPEKEYVEQYNYFFGYDPVLDQYKIVCSFLVWSTKLQTRYRHNWILLLEAGSSWKRIELGHPHFARRQRLCISGVFYYLAHSDVSGENIISFDVRSEDFNTIQLPHGMSENQMGYLELIEYGGKLTIFDHRHQEDQSGLLNLWVLEDTERWSKKSLVLQPCQMHFFPNEIYFDLIGTTQNGEVVFKPYDMEMHSSHYILYYDLHKNDVRRVDVRGIWKEPLQLALMEGENIMHLKI